MNVAQTVAEVLRGHVTLECECIDRMYLNVYVPQLQSVGGVVRYLHAHHGQRFASTAGGGAMAEAFLREIDRFAEREGVEVVQFQKWQRKDDVTQEYRARFEGTEGVLYIGKAQEKARVMCSERRRNAEALEKEMRALDRVAGQLKRSLVIEMVPALGDIAKATRHRCFAGERVLAGRCMDAGREGSGTAFKH